MREREIMKILIAVALACALGCATSERASTLAQEHRGAPTAKRFAVLYTNALVPISPDLENARDRVLGRVTRYLSIQGRERRVVEPSRTEDLWPTSVAEVNANDALPNTFYEAVKVFARRLSESMTFDALVVPSLVYREARLKNLHIKWDGAVRKVRKVEDEEREIPKSFIGSVPAVSLHLMVFDSEGELVFENYGGLDVVHELFVDPRKQELVARLSQEILTEHRWLNDGTELAFEPYLPRSELSDW